MGDTWRTGCSVLWIWHALIIHVGVLAFFMILLVAILNACGLNYFEPFTGEHYCEAAVWVAISINIAIYGLSTFQMWLFHRLRFWPRTLLWLAIIIGVPNLFGGLSL